MSPVTHCDPGHPRHAPMPAKMPAEATAQPPAEIPASTLMWLVEALVLGPDRPMAPIPVPVARRPVRRPDPALRWID